MLSSLRQGPRRKRGAVGGIALDGSLPLWCPACIRGTLALSGYFSHCYPYRVLSSRMMVLRSSHCALLWAARSLRVA